MTKLTGQLA